MAPVAAWPHDDRMPETALRPRVAATLALRSLAVVGALAVALSGCSTAAPASTDELIPDVAELGDPGGDSGGGAGDVGDDEVTVIGADLTTGSAALIAEIYAEGRDPIPTVEFLDATTVRFAWPEGSLTEDQALSNCQIAYGSMSGEGVRVLFAIGDAEADCTAEIEG